MTEHGPSSPFDADAAVTRVLVVTDPACSRASWVDVEPGQAVG